MSEFVIKGVPTTKVKNICRTQEAAGATKCEGKETGGGLSDVTVVFPKVEHFDDRKARLSSK